MKWHIPYEGREWIFEDGRITASEARLQKRITNGMTPGAAETARLEADPDAWIAALAIARRRAGLDLDEAVTIDDERLELTAISDATKAALEEDVTGADTADDADTADEGDAAPADEVAA